MKKRIGFQKQRDPGTCGQRSLIHALLLLNHPISERQAFKACDVTRKEVNEEGTDEKELKLALKYFGHEYSVLDTYSRKAAHHFINKHLDAGRPIIICVQFFQHWAVLARRDNSKYVWIDSADDKLIGSWKIQDILGWMRCLFRYYAIAIKPLP